MPLAAADAVAAEHAYHGAVDRDRERNEGYGLRRQLGAARSTKQEQGLSVHVLHDGGQPAGQHPAGDAFAPSKHAARHFLGGEAIGVAHRSCARTADYSPVIGQRHAPAVQTKQLAHQMQHLAKHQARRQAATHQPHDLAHEQQLLGAPVGWSEWRQERGLVRD